MSETRFPTFRGAVPEVITPFHPDGSIAYELLQGEMEHCLRGGVGAIFTNGLASEVLSLSPQEQIDVTAAVVKYVGGRVPVMGNVGCNTLEDGLSVVWGYEAAGVDAISIEQPCVYKLPEEGLLNYFRTLISATKLPVCIYNAPQTGNTLSPGAVASLFHEFEQVHYYKESTIDFIHIQNTLRRIGHDRPMELLGGSDATSWLLMLLGSPGTISIISTVFPKPVKDMCDAYFAGDVERARDLQDFILDIRDTLKTGPFVAGYKYASTLAGVPLGSMRKPLAELSEADKGKIKEKLTKLGLI